ncbi:MAG: HAMP domain-containing histidine kinase [Myxococcota bacterium]|nr:HAMP domain-containing histidine kinase [Myxococcota bacterium]
MAKRSITVELDDETIRDMSVLGEPIDVLALLACSAADAVRYPGRPRREQTDESLRTERNKADGALTKERELVEAAADELVRIARERADHVVQTARDDADGEHPPRSTTAKASSEHERRQADGLVEHERSSADAVLKNERAARHRPDSVLASVLAVEREAMDKDLTGERAYSDSLIVDQRDANQQLVIATLRSQELAHEADLARHRAEDSESKLRAVADFREMFIGILGHDLRNPLGSISMASGLLLKRGHLDEQDARTVSIILRNGERMSRMIIQLLDLTRARLGGGLPIEPKPADLRAICQDVVEECHATIQLEVAGDVTGTWDEDRLAEALSNLAGNAIEYSTPGAAVIVKVYADGAEAVVEITNQGEPIPTEVRPFIFEPFRRARQREKSSTGNLGLGLYIAHQIVLSHGGTLDAHSAGGRTTFVMRLPRRPVTGEI